jgi:hypothetical protein
MTPTEARSMAERFLKGLGCNCAGVDIGVGTMHETHCGCPTPDDIMDLILSAASSAEERAREEERERCGQSLWDEFIRMRFGPFHEALGDIRLSIGEQERIVGSIRALGSAKPGEGKGK